MGNARRGSPYTPGQYPVADLLLGMVADPSNEVPIGPAAKGLMATIDPSLLSAGAARTLKALQSLKGKKWADIVGRLADKKMPADAAASQLDHISASRGPHRPYGAMPAIEAVPPETGKYIMGKKYSSKDLGTLGRAIEKQPLDDVSMSYVRGGGEGGADYSIDAAQAASRADSDRIAEKWIAQKAAEEAAAKQEWAKKPAFRWIKEPSINPKQRANMRMDDELAGDAGKLLEATPGGGQASPAPEMTLQPIEGGAAQQAAQELDPAVWGLEARQARAAAEDAAEEAATKELWAQQPTTRSFNETRLAAIPEDKGLLKNEYGQSFFNGGYGLHFGQGKLAEQTLLERTIEALRRRAAKEPLTLSPLSKLPE